MAKTAKRRVGDTGEEVACKYLVNKGFSILERNYLKPWGEIDIIAERNKRLHFVEVKAVSREAGDWDSHERMRPEENMHQSKLKRLHRAIQTYLLDRHVGEQTEWQIDLALVYLDFSARRAKVDVLDNIVL